MEHAVRGLPPVAADPMTEVARRAAAGDRAALGQVCRELQDPIYRLALRMFPRPADAADATQEAPPWPRPCPAMTANPSVAAMP